MIKKKYIKPSIYSKKARVMRMIMGTPGTFVPDGGLGDGEDDNLNGSQERGIFDSPASYDNDWNSLW